ncbi:T9SS type A sorting domain-containing protein [Winogradskyella sp. A3E31]|uniref:T9SS type A sorting domain-containing protein n=1 Tax=Winogradskyella sp. A3E31 TaxID=3349637 RepID=UPI00398B28B6
MKIKLLVLLLLIGSYSAFGQSNSNDVVLNNSTIVDDFSIKPNPSSNFLNIKLDEFTTELSIEVYDVLGKRIYNGKLTKLETSIQVSGWKSGVYLVRVSNDITTHTKRFMKQ